MVFDRLFQVTKPQGAGMYGGLGLGLYIANQIIMRHGGSMWLKSKLRIGTTFYFRIPIKMSQLKKA